MLNFFCIFAYMQGNLKKLVMFDMDGVLLDSIPTHILAWTQALKEHGVDIEPDFIYLNEGRTGKDTIELIEKQTGRKLDWTAVYRRKSELFRRHGGNRPMTGTLEVLNEIKKYGVRSIVVTGSGHNGLKDILEGLYPSLLDNNNMVTAYDTVRGKPYPDPYLEGLRKTGAPAAEAIVIENAPLGVQAAHNAGCFVIAVNTGILPDSALWDAGADIVFHSMAELAPAIHRFLQTGSEPGLWKTKSSGYLIKRPWLTARKDHVVLPDGHENPEHWVIEYSDWVNVIAITKKGEFVFERQYRHGLGIVEYEICAGVIEKGETPVEAAKRELLEETGYCGGEWSLEMVTCQNPSVCSNLTYCFIARGVEQASGQKLDYTEDISVHLLSAKEVHSLLKADRLKQALMTAPLWKYFAENPLTE